MSIVTNVILLSRACDWEDNEADMLPALNAHFNPWAGFKPLDPQTVGGTKGFEANALVGAFNYLILDDLITHLRTLPWREPEHVQLLVKEPHDERFRLIDLFPEA